MNPGWLCERARVLALASFWHTIRHSTALGDRRAWIQGIQQRGNESYPESLRQNIVALNHPVLRAVISSYFAQVEKAIAWGDLVSVQHRVAALLASYFDVIFAVNREMHPGEKRMSTLAARRCSRLPLRMERDVHDVLSATAEADGSVLKLLSVILDRLDAFLLEEGFAGS